MFVTYGAALGFEVVSDIERRNGLDIFFGEAFSDSTELLTQSK
jgi:hypothetical protein